MRSPIVVLLAVVWHCRLILAVDIGKYHYLYPGKPQNGGTDDIRDKIIKAYGEVVEMARGASGAIQKILDGKPSQTFNDRDGYFLWQKYAVSLTALFDLKLDIDLDQQTQEVQNKLNEIKKSYDTIVARADEDAGNQRIVIYYTDSFLGRVTPNTPFKPDRGSVAPHVRWWAPPINDKRVPFNKPGVMRPGGAQGRTADICAGRTIASTLPDVAAIVICIKAVTADRPTTLAGQEGNIKVDDNDIEQSSRIDEFKSLSRTLMHELFHMYFKFHDELLPNFQIAKDANGKEQVVRDANDIPIWLPGTSNTKAYGYMGSYWLARQDAPKCTTNVDCYVIFAMTVFFKDYQWATQKGRAQTFAANRVPASGGSARRRTRMRRSRLSRRDFELAPRNMTAAIRVRS